MNGKDTFKKPTSEGEHIVSIGDHTGITTPFFAPEVKNWHNDLHVTLNHRSVLDENNPILVPAWDWTRLREKNSILQRTNEDGDQAGEEEIQQLEEQHPLIHYFPPELLFYRGKTNILRTYLLKRNREARKDFKTALQDGQVENALSHLPKFVRPFIESNFGPILSDFGIEEESITSTEVHPAEIWKSVPEAHYDEFFRQIADEAMELPSAVVVPPVPLIEDYDSNLATTMCVANSKMAEYARSDGNPRTFFHLYLHYLAFSDGSGDEADTAAQAQNILRNEVREGEFSGIAVTIYRGEEVFETSTAPRVGTFFKRLGRFAVEEGLPVICPRSEWLGLWATDYGIDGFSSLYNGSWVYRSGGAVDDVDRYGYTMVRSESRAVKLRSDDGTDVEGQLSEGGLPTMDGLPSTPPEPPEDFEPSNDLQAEYGTSFYYRRHFGKPQRLNHAWEAQKVRSSEESSPAQNHLLGSENEYIEFPDE